MFHFWQHCLWPWETLNGSEQLFYLAFVVVIQAEGYTASQWKLQIMLLLFTRNDHVPKYNHTLKVPSEVLITCGAMEQRFHEWISCLYLVL